MTKKGNNSMGPIEVEKINALIAHENANEIIEDCAAWFRDGAKTEEEIQTWLRAAYKAEQIHINDISPLVVLWNCCPKELPDQRDKYIEYAAAFFIDNTSEDKCDPVSFFCKANLNKDAKQIEKLFLKKYFELVRKQEKDIHVMQNHQKTFVKVALAVIILASVLGYAMHPVLEPVMPWKGFEKKMKEVDDRTTLTPGPKLQEGKTTEVPRTVENEEKLTPTPKTKLTSTVTPKASPTVTTAPDSNESKEQKTQYISNNPDNEMKAEQLITAYVSGKKADVRIRNEAEKKDENIVAIFKAGNLDHKIEIEKAEWDNKEKNLIFVPVHLDMYMPDQLMKNFANMPQDEYNSQFIEKYVKQLQNDYNIRLEAENFAKWISSGVFYIGREYIEINTEME